ncbi:MMPL family transporter [Lactiplantibacillus plajomi]|uniref:MMPL family transporter n=1 Tax=Lactiplantibacillus plajomi TaxID=1457217 RepID=A0ABV6K0G8_9LACO|nr:MMPL family transporter [Lactiplantibacillus plajomi]
MRKVLKPKFYFLLFWIIMVVASIAALPNVSQWLTRQSTAANSSQTSSQTYRWEHGLDGTKQLTLVFNNPSGKLTASQKMRITDTLATIRSQADQYGIRQLRTTTLLANDRDLLSAADGSTELAIAAVKSKTADLPIIANELNNAMADAGVNTAVTSPQLVVSDHQQRHREAVISSFLIGTAALLLVLGLIFRSLAVPLINLTIQAVVTLITTSLVINAQQAWQLPIDVTALTLIGWITLAGTSFLTWSYMRDYWQQTVEKDDNVAASLVSLQRQYHRWPVITVPLVLVLIVLSWTSSPLLASGWALGVAILMTGLATPTLNFVLTSLLGDVTFWPGTQLWTARPKNTWGQLSRFGHWRPFWGCVLAGLLVLPGLLLARPTYDDTQLQPSGPLSNAEYGQQLLTAHFGAGAANPVTLTLHTAQPLTEQKSLQAIDTLTTKLQVLPNVDRVVSVTQPTGHRLNTFYVKQQVNLINADLVGKQTTVTNLQKALATDRQHLDQAKITAHTEAVDRLSDSLNQVADTNDQLLTQLSALNTTLAEPSTVRHHVGRINQQFSALDQTTDDLMSGLNDLVDRQTTVAEQAKHVSKRVRQVNRSLKKSRQSLATVLASLKVTQSYLTGLANSQIGDSFYLPANGQKNQRYQSSLFTNVSSSQHSTRLTITLATGPNDPQSLKTMQTIRRVTKDSFSATALSHASLQVSGVVNQQQRHHALISRHATVWCLLVLGLLTLGFWLIMRSLTAALLVTGGLAAVTISSWGLTQLVMVNWAHSGTLASTTFVWGAAVIGGHWLIATVPVIRHQLHGAATTRTLLAKFYRGGQTIWPPTLLALAYLLPLAVTGDTSGYAWALMASAGLLLTNLTVPLLFPASLTWRVRPPKWSLHPLKK